jgi:hypothetical protein
LTYFIDIVHSSHELISQAQKYIKEMAGFVASGPKHDKDAIGSFYTNNLMIAVSESKRVLNYLESNLKNIEFNTQQLERMYRERVAISRINNTMLNEGLGLSFEMSTSSANISNSSKKEAEIKTFNYSGK